MKRSLLLVYSPFAAVKTLREWSEIDSPSCAHEPRDTTKFAAAPWNAVLLTGPFLSVGKLPVRGLDTVEANWQHPRTDGCLGAPGSRMRRLTLFIASSHLQAIKFLSTAIDFEDGNKGKSILEFASVDF